MTDLVRVCRILGIYFHEYHIVACMPFISGVGYFVKKSQLYHCAEFDSLILFLRQLGNYDNILQI